MQQTSILGFILDEELSMVKQNINNRREIRIEKDLKFEMGLCQTIHYDGNSQTEKDMRACERVSRVEMIY